MFAIDTSAAAGGESGPFLSFSPRGSVQYHLPQNAWYVREKDQAGNWQRRLEQTIETQGVLLDVFATPQGEFGGSLKIGHVKDGGQGQAPIRQWWASPLVAQPRPDDARKPDGGFVWSNAVSVKVALGQGVTAILELDGWGGFKGLMDLFNALNPQFAANLGKVPLIRCTGYQAQGQGNQATTIPQFEVAAWYDRPESLSATPQIATGAVGAPGAQAAPPQGQFQQPAPQQGQFQQPPQQAAPPPQQAPAAPPPAQGIPANASF